MGGGGDSMAEREWEQCKRVDGGAVGQWMEVHLQEGEQWVMLFHLSWEND